ncbi:hypothetical protein GCM10010350_64820 [Streptomyces galilaeus]|nr:hypothetical protein GCM10010350_64820 [Streptomyces galilaeus]
MHQGRHLRQDGVVVLDPLMLHKEIELALHAHHPPFQPTRPTLHCCRGRQSDEDDEQAYKCVHDTLFLADETEVARASAAERRRPYGAAEVAYDRGRTARRAS